MTRSNRSPAAGPGGLDLGGVADERDRDGLAARGRLARPGERLVGSTRQPVDVADLEPAPGPRLVDLDREADALVHRHGQRLGAAHPAEPGGQRRRVPAQRAAEVLAGGLGEGLVRALQDALRPDVDPRARGHLAVHHQARLARARGSAPRSPTCRRGSSWRSGRAAPTGASAATPTGLPDWTSSVSSSAEAAQLADDRVEGGPAARRPAGPAVDDEVVGVLGDLGVQVVHEHPQGGLLLPAAAATARCRGARGRDGRRSSGGASLAWHAPRLLRPGRP